MDDFELNKGIAEALGLTNDDGGGYHQPRLQILSNPEGHQMVDYCNNWNDLMPLVLDSHIQMYVHAENYYTIDDGEVGGFCRQGVHKDKIRRTLAECLLKVLEAK